MERLKDRGSEASECVLNYSLIINLEFINEDLSFVGV